jgi:signal transduction histidine kinase
MDTQDEYSNDDFELEILAAFQDLTRLLHRSVPLGRDESAAIASALLERLQQMCQATTGGIFLTTFYHSEQEMMPSSFVHDTAYRSLALCGIKEEDVHSLLTSAPEEALWTSSHVCSPTWLVWRLPLVLSFPSVQDNSVEQRHHWQTKNSMPGPLSLLLFGWDEQDGAMRVSMMRRSRLILPAIANVVAAVIVRMLTSEYIHELETRTDRKALREMELLKAELLASVSHELRSPLTSIKGYASTLLRHERRISREERHEFLLAINAASDRLAEVIDSLLEVSDLETGRIEIERMPVDLARLVSEAVVVVEQKLEGPDDALSLVVVPLVHKSQLFEVIIKDSHGAATEEELIIQADLGRLREVLDHLLENALHHTPEGGHIRVLVCSVLTPEGVQDLAELTRDGGARLKKAQQRYQRMAVICIQDNGKGIPGASIQRIFDPFYRVDTRLTREVNGLGLGLTICRRIIELHDGAIWAESEIGKGSTFFVCLPIGEETGNPEVSYS